MVFTSFINWSIFLFLFYEYLNNKFPETMKNFLINFTYYCIYFFSKLQIYLKNNHVYGKYLDEITEIKEKLIVFVNHLINKYPFDKSSSNVNDKNDLLFEIISDNKIAKSIFKKELIEKLEESDVENDLLDLLDFCDFVLITDMDNNIKIVNNNNITLENLRSENSDLLKITPVNYKPLLCEMLIDSINFKINFYHKDGIYNYLVLDNVFDNKFLQYFMKTHYNFTMETEETKCPFELKILDDNVESISILQNDRLKIKETKMEKL